MSMKRKIFILVMVVLCFTTGALLAEVDEGKDSEYIFTKKTNCGAAIYTTNDILEKNYALFLSDIEIAPPELLKYCEKIIFTHENLTEKFHMPLKNKIVAISVGKDIYVCTDFYSEDTIVHELCHIYDYSNGWVSDSELFAQLYVKYKEEIPVSAGNIEDEREFFASCGEKYFTGKELPEEIAVFFDAL